MTEENNSPIKYVIFSVILLIIFYGSRILLSQNIDNNWSVNHWQFLPLTFFIVWGAITIITGILLLKNNQWLYNLFNNKISVIISSLVLMALFIIFQTDNFIYAGGNHFINQISQHEIVINNWHEYGSVFLISLFMKMTSSFNWDVNTIGVVNIKIFSFISVALTLWASIFIVRLLADDIRKRIILFLIIFFGPQTLIYFGHVGFEPVVVSFIYWYAYCAFLINDKFTINRLIMIISINLVAIFFHVSLVILIPATIFILFNKLLKLKTLHSLIGGFIAYLALLFIVYQSASDNFSYARYILFPEGLNSYRTYNLFSTQHIVDMVMLSLFFFPQIIFIKLFFFKNLKETLKDSNLITLSLIILSGSSLVIISDPIHSIILDAPRLLVYFSPVALLLGYLLLKSKNDFKKFASSFAWAAIVIPLSIIPCYTRLNIEVPYVDNFLKKNSRFYIDAGTAIQNSYTYLDNYDKANQWYNEMPVLSEDFMDLQSGKELIAGNHYSEALEVFFKLKTKYPFWPEPRYLISNIYINSSQFAQARAELDTCLMLNPYYIDHVIGDYRYYKDVNDFHEAIRKSLKALEIYSSNNTIKSDLAIYYFRAGLYKQADSLCKYLILEDKTLPYPYIVSGFLSETKRQPAEALKYYRNFLELSPNSKEAPVAQRRIDSLEVRLNNQGN